MATAIRAHVTLASEAQGKDLAADPNLGSSSAPATDDRVSAAKLIFGAQIALILSLIACTVFMILRPGSVAIASWWFGITMSLHLALAWWAPRRFQDSL